MIRVLCLVIFGCAVLPLAWADEAQLTALEAARERWRAVDTGSYVFAYHKECECDRDDERETVVTVTNGIVTGVRLRLDDSGREFPASEESLPTYWTIDDLFVKLENALAGSAAVTAEYHPQLGYPTLLYIDYLAELEGEETDLRMTHFESR